MSQAISAAELPEYAPMTLEDVAKVRDDLGRVFASGKTRDVAWRKEQILGLVYMLKDNIDLFNAALAKDLGRAPLETHILEVAPVLGDLRTLYDGVAKWSKTESMPFDVAWTAMRPRVRKEPKGCVLIISPFNYAFNLTLAPIGGALAAGCTVAFKPSELTPHLSAVFAKLFPLYVDPEVVRVVNGAVPETTLLLESQWDHIMYTGSGRVARIVLSAAAKTLSPVTTELGGKSPVFVDSTCDLKVAARRMLWGKFANAGQTCIAPDYALVQKDFQDKFVQALLDVCKEFYPDGAEKSDSFSRIITETHTSRLGKLIDATKGQIVYGGAVNIEKRFVEPTIVKDVQGDDALMAEELFGPILPIIPVSSVDAAIAYVNAHDHPLSLYIFSRNQSYVDHVTSSTRSGAVVTNDTMIHWAAPGAPFGGVGPSGSGAYKGKHTFDTFTHQRTALDSPSWLDMVLSGRYPPLSKRKADTMDLLTLPSFPGRPSHLREGKRSWGLFSAFYSAVSKVTSAVFGRSTYRAKQA
ncbi:unnamed protein product [Peniophora sp. CBMAI 1063]|nr:unnamed protein product [Peniophora sp. CBMAI 1063]